MTQKNEVYKCEVCGNIVEVTHAGAGQLVCCGQPMNLQIANSVDVAEEKHVPVIEKIDTGVKVSVGSVPHPMSDEHYIEWIEILADEKVYRRDLNPDDEPSAEFEIKAEKITARAYCNLHGLWQVE